MFALIYSCKKTPTTSQNTTPTASFTVNPTSGTTDTNFDFDASGSTDTEDSISELEARWDWENDGTWDTNYSTLKNETHMYNLPEYYTIKLEVKDSGGLTHTTTSLVDIIGIYSTVNVKTSSDYFSFANNSGSSNAMSLHDIMFYTIQWQPAPNVSRIYDPQFKVRGGLSIAVLKGTNLDDVTEIPTNFILNYSTKYDSWYYTTNSSIVLSHENVWVVRTSDGRYPAFVIKSYYDEQGNSGVFSIEWKYLS